MFKKLFPVVVILFVILVVFRKFFIEGLIPIPGDLLIGAYYPWLDYNWGFPTGVPVKNPLPSDVISLLYPWRVLGMEMVKNGIMPLWDSTILLGTPLLANFQAALLNPLNILFLIFPPKFAWGLQVVLQPLLIALATFLFLKNLRLNKWAAVFGGLSFAFSGFSIVWMEYNTIGYTLLYFPLVLFLIDKIIQTEKIINAFLLGIVIAFQIFSGYPQVSIYTLIFSSIYFMFRLYEKMILSLNRLLIFILGLVSAFLFSAIQLLPSFELLQLSIRSIDNTAANSGIQFLPLTHLITLFIPDFFGNPVTGNYWLGSYDNFAFSLPAVTLFLALFALISKTIFKKESLIFLIFIVLSMLLALDNPFSQFISGSDYFGLKSAVATRALFIFDFALVVVAAYGLNEILVKGKYKLVFILLTFLVIALMTEGALTLLKFTNESYLQIAVRNSVLPILSVSLIAASLMISKLGRVNILIVFSVLFLNIFVATDKYLSFIDSRLLFPQTEAIKTLQNNLNGHRFDREKGEIFSSNTWIPYGLKAASGQNALYPQTTSKYLGLVNGSYPNYLFRFVDMTGVRSPLYNTLDIKYVMVLKRQNGQSPNLIGEPKPEFLISKFKEYKDIGTVKILENTQNLGFAWFSRNVKCSLNEKETADILKQENYNPGELMVVSCLPGQEVQNIDRGDVSIISNSSGNLKFTLKTPLKNYLHLSQVNYPGWQALLNGKEIPIYSSNLALTAISIPEGNHIVEINYHPQSFTMGWQISLTTLVVWLTYLMVTAFVKRHKLQPVF